MADTKEANIQPDYPAEFFAARRNTYIFSSLMTLTTYYYCGCGGNITFEALTIIAPPKLSVLIGLFVSQIYSLIHFLTIGETYRTDWRRRTFDAAPNVTQLIDVIRSTKGTVDTLKKSDIDFEELKKLSDGLQKIISENLEIFPNYIEHINKEILDIIKEKPRTSNAIAAEDSAQSRMQQLIIFNQIYNDTNMINSMLSKTLSLSINFDYYNNYIENFIRDRPFFDKTLLSGFDFWLPILAVSTTILLTALEFWGWTKLSTPCNCLPDGTRWLVWLSANAIG